MSLRSSVCLVARTFSILICLSLAASAQTTPFEFRDILQNLTIDSPANPLSGGTLTVQGITVKVPSGTLIVLPTQHATLAYLFIGTTVNADGSVSFVLNQSVSGLSAADTVPPRSPCVVHVVGNIVASTYIAGLVTISLPPGSSGQGVINFIDYANGEVRVGGTIGIPNSGTRVRIADPHGVFGKQTFAPSFDPRFSANVDFPTIRSKTGFPMGLPISAAGDPLRPFGNRPTDSASNPLTSFQMED